jgi:hypothetical protein
MLDRLKTISTAHGTNGGRMKGAQVSSEHGGSPPAGDIGPRSIGLE